MSLVQQTCPNCCIQAEEIDRLQAKNDAHQKTFDLTWKASMRGIKIWQEANPGNDLVWPDHGDLVAWLLQERETLRGALTQLCRSIDVQQPSRIRDAHENAVSVLTEGSDKRAGEANG